MSGQNRSPEELATGLARGDRIALARAITLIESAQSADAENAEKLFSLIGPNTRPNAFRLGITGAPGAGKSTLIEKLGMHLCRHGRHVAVLAIDPSSSISGGSILGDKTRMNQLAHHTSAFVRPSPSLGAGGGLGYATADAAKLCEAAGYDFIIIETVGVGQGEIDVRDVADVVLVLLDPGAGDGLQAVKRGLLEVADLIAITKADGARLEEAENTKSEFATALHTFAGEKAPQLLLSSTEDDKLIGAIANELEKREIDLQPTLASRRSTQTQRQFTRTISKLASEWASRHPIVQQELAALKEGAASNARKVWSSVLRGR